MSLENSWTSLMVTLCEMVEAKLATKKNIQDKGKA